MHQPSAPYTSPPSEMRGQLALPVDVQPAEVMRKRTLAEAVALCAELGGLHLDKQISDVMGVKDKGQFSRMMAGTEGIKWCRLKALMQACGNEVPLLWMAHDCNFDIASMHKVQTETERQNKLLREENAALRRVLLGGGVRP